MLKEFKEFAFKGNMLDLAIAVIIGGAFSKIITSLVNDIFTPILGILMGKVDVSKIVLSPFGIEIRVGLFMQNLIDFIIVAFALFLIVKAINTYKNSKAEEVKEVDEVKISKEEELLREIRDILLEKTPLNK